MASSDNVINFVPKMVQEKLKKLEDYEKISDNPEVLSRYVATMEEILGEYLRFGSVVEIGEKLADLKKVENYKKVLSSIKDAVDCSLELESWG